MVALTYLLREQTIIPFHLPGRTVNQLQNDLSSDPRAKRFHHIGLCTSPAEAQTRS